MEKPQGDKAALSRDYVKGRIPWDIQDLWNACDDPWERFSALAKRYVEIYPEDDLYDFLVFILINILGESPRVWREDSPLIQKVDHDIEQDIIKGRDKWVLSNGP